MKDEKIHNITSSGYKAPKHYFDSVEESILNKLNQNGDIEDIKDTGYQVPDNYFETVEQSILEKVDSDNASVIQLSFRKRVYYIAGIAASLIIALSIYLNNEDQSILSEEMVETYFQNSDLNSYEIAELLTEAEFLEDDFDLLESEFNEDNLESYLLENADLESIIE